MRTMRLSSSEGYYTRTMLGVIADARLFSEFVTHKIPKLATHMQKLKVDLQPIAVRWFLCLFVNIFPLETSLRFFDFLFLEGDKVRTGVLVLSLMLTDALSVCFGFTQV